MLVSAKQMNDPLVKMGWDANRFSLADFRFTDGHGDCDCGKRDVQLLIASSQVALKALFHNGKTKTGRVFSLGHECLLTVKFSEETS